MSDDDYLELIADIEKETEAIEEIQSWCSNAGRRPVYDTIMTPLAALEIDFSPVNDF